LFKLIKTFVNVEFRSKTNIICTRKKNKTLNYLLIVLSILVNTNLSAQHFFKTPYGSCYHTPTCEQVKNTSKQISLNEAKELRLKPCSFCNPQHHGGNLKSPKKAKGESKIKHQCIGRTKKGFRCKHVTKIANSYCYQHEP
jgi:putative component of membrane protein insertase Oxa1/YidC/SpoIIIJ protein YidD